MNRSIEKKRKIKYVVKMVLLENYENEEIIEKS